MRKEEKDGNDRMCQQEANLNSENDTICVFHKHSGNVLIFSLAVSIKL